MRYLIAFGRFWYDFLVGDDPKTVIAVLVAVALLCIAVATTSLGDDALAVGGGVLVVLAFLVSLVLDTRRTR